MNKNILEAAMYLYNEKGLHFTMQDLCDYMHIAKKTIYKMYPSKEDLLVDIVDSGFEEIHRKKKEIMESDLPTVEKIRRAVIALPEEYMTMDFHRMEEAEGKYPRLLEALSRNLETNWEPTIALLEQGMEEGVIRNINIPVFRVMVTSSIEAFLQNKDIDMSYPELLEEMMNILMEGICDAAD